MVPIEKQTPPNKKKKTSEGNIEIIAVILLLDYHAVPLKLLVYNPHLKVTLTKIK